jgi:hypothetical protein
MTTMKPEVEIASKEHGQTMTEICRIYVHSHYTWDEFKHLADPSNITPLAAALRNSMTAEFHFESDMIPQMAITIANCFQSNFEGPAFRWSKQELQNYVSGMVVRSADFLQIASSFWHVNDPAP